MNDILQMLQQVIRLYSRRDLARAEQVCRSILSMEPENADAIHFLGIIAFDVGNLPAAKQLVQAAMDRMPHNASCYLNMGNIVHQEGQVDQAIAYYSKAIELDPSNKQAYSNLGVAYKKTRALDKAVKMLEKAIKLDSRYVEAHNNLGEIFKHQGRYDDALDCCEKALAIAPDFVSARWNRSILYLLAGRFDQGFKEYEWRWKRPETPVRVFQTGQPWDGSPFPGKTLFVYEEQGMGDTFQFLRYLPLVKELGGHVIFEVLMPSIRLLEGFAGIDRLYAGIRNQDTRPVDRFDLHVPLLSLPGLLKTQPGTIPAKVPYLNADPALAQIWDRRMGASDRFRVGLVWAGHQGHNNDANRSTRLSAWAGLADLDGVALFSLQKDQYPNWTDVDPAGFFEKDLGGQISDFADTAAIMANLDLVISVDTAVVHLAGALARPVWTLLPFSPDWRWMLDREDSPWYPTMRLFRQSSPDDWQGVMDRVCQALAQQVRAGSG